jgi:hypothetical protein
VSLPNSIFACGVGLNGRDYSRLFPQIDAACHHGGAGTTGASLRAGLPTIIRPFFGDQFFWASRVQALKAGLKLNSLTRGELQKALVKATQDRVMREKAAMVGERIRAENGTRSAVEFLYSELGLAWEIAETKVTSFIFFMAENYRRAEWTEQRKHLDRKDSDNTRRRKGLSWTWSSSDKASV